MSIKNFGAVMDFAIQLENGDASFLERVLHNPEMQGNREVLEGLAKENKKNAKTLSRARQENVTEMILEPIQGLESEDYPADMPEPVDMDQVGLVEKLKELEDRAQRFYLEAGERIKPVSDVAGTFQRLAKKRRARREKLEQWS